MGKIRQVVIVAGGQGNRLRDITGSLPKCLVQIDGVDLLSQNIERLAIQGFNKFLLLLGQYSEQIIARLPKMIEGLRVELNYVLEDKPLGTGGALINAVSELDDYFLLLHGDLYVNFSADVLIESLFSTSADYAQVFHSSSHMHDSDLLELDSSNRITGYFLKPHSLNLLTRNRANAGVYAFSRSILTDCRFDKTIVDLDRDILPTLIKSGRKGIAVRNTGFIKDIGTPERLEQTIRDIKDSLKLCTIRPAVFLDRDGTLNVERGYISSPNQIELYRDSFELISYCNQIGMRLIVVTNQPVIARGEASVRDIELIHARIDQILGAEGLFIDEYYYCPHHPDSGFDGEILELKISCDCRKPKNGLIEEALRDFSIERQFSFMIGDSYSDIEAGFASRLNTVLVSRKNKKYDSGRVPDFLAPDLGAAVKIIEEKLRNWPLPHEDLRVKPTVS